MTINHVIVESIQCIELIEPGKYLIELIKPDAEVTLTGFFQTAQTDQQVVAVTIHHRAPRTKATITLKGVARDQSQIKFFGKIIIDKNCGGSNAFLTERILLLSDQAKAEVVPELEILSDDVKCSHAASVSNIPEAQLFYLRSRGLSRAAAENLIVEGFLS